MSAGLAVKRNQPRELSPPVPLHGVPSGCLSLHEEQPSVSGDEKEEDIERLEERETRSECVRKGCYLFGQLPSS